MNVNLQGLAVTETNRAAHALFEETFATSVQRCIRAPGRVNLIGEHIDYCGFSVLPMAIDKTLTLSFAMEAVEDAGASEIELLISNADHEDFPSAEYTLSLAALLRGDIDVNFPHWTSYVLSAAKGVSALFPPTACSSAGRWRVSALVESALPHSAGLSSSSALVCASTLMFALCLSEVLKIPGGLEVSAEDLAENSCRAERFVGTCGGGMDQAVCFTATEDFAKLISFVPVLAHRDVRLPDPGQYKWLLSHCGVDSKKSMTASRLFNKRVLECRCAGALLLTLLHQKSLFVPGKGVAVSDFFSQTPIPMCVLESQCAAAGVVMEDFVREFYPKREFSFNEICDFCNISQDKTAILRGEFREIIEISDVFRLYSRLLHILTESKRVAQFTKLCEQNGKAENAILLGNLLNESHRSCSEMYECSCPELDLLQEKCLAAGAVGSRMTGAGWGGFVVSLVPTGRVENFLAEMSSYASFETSASSGIKLTLSSPL